MAKNRSILSALVVVSLGWPTLSVAASGVPLLLPFQGRATDDSTPPQPITSAATFVFRIYPASLDPVSGTDCYIYEETQTVTPNSYGYFAVLLGKVANRSGTLANSFVDVFNNEVSLPTSCSTTFTPSAGEWRRIQMIIDGVTMPDMQTIGSSPFAINAQLFDGKSSTSFIKVDAPVTQANLLTLTDGSDANGLHSHDSAYAKLGGSNSFTGNLATSGSFYGTGASSAIGIGTSSPASDIDVRKTSPGLTLGATSGSGGTMTLNFLSGSTQRAQIRASESSNELRFYTGTTEAMRLDSNQNLYLSGSMDVAGTLNLGQYTSAQETTLIATLTAMGASAAGATWMNTTSGELKYWNGSAAVAPGTGLISSVSAGTGLTNTGTASDPVLEVSYGSAAGTAIEGNSSFGGDVSGSYTSLTVSKIQGRSVASLSPSDSEILTWNGAASRWEPHALSAIGAGTLPDARLSSNVPLKNSANAFTAFHSISVATQSSRAMMLKTTDDNTTNNLFEVLSSGGTVLGSIRADGVASAATDLTTKSYVDNKLASRAVSTSAPSTNDILKWNGSAWALAADLGITSISGDVAASGSGAVTATINSSAVTATKIANDAIGSAKINSTGIAVSRILITNSSDGNTVTYASCGVDGQVLKFSSATGWGCASDVGASGVVSNITAGSGLLGGSITTVGTISVDLGTTANKIVALDASAKLPAVDGSQLTSVNATKLQSYTIGSTAPASGEVLKWNGSMWLPGTDSGGISALTTDVIASGTGSVVATLATNSVTNTKIANDSITAGKLNSTGIAGGKLLMTDTVSTSTITYKGCSLNEILKWTASGWDCAADSMPSQSNNTVVANISGSTAAPSAVTMTALLDATVSSTQGALIYRGASNWASLSPGTSGQFLKTLGAAANPAWADIPAADLSTATGTLAVSKGGTGVTSLAGTFVLAGGQTGALTLGTSNASTVTINANNAAAITVTSSGQVGIGTATPGAKLEIASGSAGVSGLKFTNFNSSTATSTGQAVGVDASGNLVTVSGGGGGVSYPLTGSLGSSSAPTYSYSGDTDTGVFSPGAGLVAITTNATERMRIDASGNLGIGTTAASSSLSFGGSVARSIGIERAATGTGANLTITAGAGFNDLATLTNNSGGDLILSSGISNGSGSSKIQFRVYDGTTGTAGVDNAARTAVTILGNGYVGIGTTSPSYTIDASGGTIRVTNLLSSSDMRLKKNVRPIEGVSFISQLNGVRFTWIKDGQPDFGLIAQDVEQVAPEAVSTDGQGFKSVKYANFIAPLIESVKELDRRCDPSQVTALRSQITELERRLQAVESALGKR